MQLERTSFLGVKAVRFTDARWKRQPSDPLYVFGTGLPVTTITETPIGSEVIESRLVYISSGARDTSRSFLCALDIRSHICVGQQPPGVTRKHNLGTEDIDTAEISEGRSCATIQMRLARAWIAHRMLLGR